MAAEDPDIKDLDPWLHEGANEYADSALYKIS